MPGPSTSDLIFSEQANHNFSKTLGALKRSALSIHNRLQSIQYDAVFAQSVEQAYGRPLIANERCGSWYIDPDHKGGSAYFKSTDGHTGVWKFSSRRLNLHLLEVIEKNDGCIIVDSTRRGKRMPDALSKTIPIWCSIVNRFLFPNQPEFHQLYTPPQVISDTEHAQMSALLPSFLTSLESLNLRKDDFKTSISKPLRPIWITPDSSLAQTNEVFKDFHPIICCTVSCKVSGTELSGGDYIQGAGDDTENWAHGLTPSIFWANQENLLSTPECDLPELIEALLKRTTETQIGSGGYLRCLKPTSCLFVTRLPTLEANNIDLDTGVITLLPSVTKESTWKTSKKRLDIGIGPHKLGSRNLRQALPAIVDFASNILYEEEQPGSEGHVIISCETGKDLSLAVALALLCLFFNDEGKLLQERRDKSMIDKSFIRHRLGWISTSMPDANPSRASLQSVNSFLM